MRAILAATLVVACTGFVQGQDEDKYVNKAGKYSIAFPDGVKVKTMDQDSGGLKMYTASGEAKGNAYVVMYADFPAAVADVPTKVLFDGAEKGAVGEGGKLVSSKDLTHGPKKLPAREIVINKDGSKLRTRLVLSGTRLYIVIVGGEKDFADSDEAKDFIKSFEVTK